MAETKGRKGDDDELTDLGNGWEASSDGEKQNMHNSTKLIEIEQTKEHQLEPLMFEKQRSYSEGTGHTNSMIDVPGANKKPPKILVNS